MIKRKLFPMLVGVLLAALVLSATLVVLAGPGGPEPPGGSVKTADVFTIVNAGYYTTTGTHYGTTNLRYIYYNSMDLFVTIDLKTTGSVTVTPQYSADGVNYVDASYTAEGWVLPQTTVLTKTSTATFASGTATRVSESVPYRVVLSADGTDVVRIPMVGKYMRPKIQLSGGITNGVTVTVQAVARNN